MEEINKEIPPFWWDLLFENGQGYNPQINNNLNFVPGIIVLKFQIDLSTRTKAFTWKPLFLQTFGKHFFCNCTKNKEDLKPSEFHVVRSTIYVNNTRGSHEPESLTLLFMLKFCKWLCFEMVLWFHIRIILKHFPIRSYIKLVLWWQPSLISNWHEKFEFCKGHPKIIHVQLGFNQTYRPWENIFFIFPQDPPRQLSFQLTHFVMKHLRHIPSKSAVNSFHGFRFIFYIYL